MPVRTECPPPAGASAASAASLIPPPPINTQQPGVATSLLYSGSKFRGHQKSKGNSYDVEVVLQVSAGPGPGARGPPRGTHGPCPPLHSSSPQSRTRPSPPGLLHPGAAPRDLPSCCLTLSAPQPQLAAPASPEHSPRLGARPRPPAIRKPSPRPWPPLAGPDPGPSSPARSPSQTLQNSPLASPDTGPSPRQTRVKFSQTRETCLLRPGVSSVRERHHPGLCGTPSPRACPDEPKTHN